MRLMNIVLTTVASNNIYADNGPATSKQTKAASGCSDRVMTLKVDNHFTKMF